jgi:hypothetical protein
MVSSEERLKILTMIEEGKISAAEGSQLLESLNKGPEPDADPEITPATAATPATATTPAAAPRPSPPAPVPAGGPRWFRVRVTDTKSGKPKTTVNLPLNLVNWGMRIGAQFAPEVANINLDELGEILQSSTEGKIIDVLDEEDGEHVEIYID